jgi:hypothetical protein
LSHATGRRYSSTFHVKNTFFSHVMSHSLADIYQLFRWTYCLHLHSWRLSQASKQSTLFGVCSAYSYIMKMETSSFKFWASFCLTIWCHILGNNNLHSSHCENDRSHLVPFIFNVKRLHCISVKESCGVEKHTHAWLSLLLKSRLQIGVATLSSQ